MYEDPRWRRSSSDSTTKGAPRNTRRSPPSRIANQSTYRRVWTGYENVSGDSRRDREQDVNVLPYRSQIRETEIQDHGYGVRGGAGRQRKTRNGCIDRSAEYLTIAEGFRALRTKRAKLTECGALAQGPGDDGHARRGGSQAFARDRQSKEYSRSGVPGRPSAPPMTQVLQRTSLRLDTVGISANHDTQSCRMTQYPPCEDR